MKISGTREKTEYKWFRMQGGELNCIKSEPSQCERVKERKRQHMLQSNTNIKLSIQGIREFHFSFRFEGEKIIYGLV